MMFRTLFESVIERLAIRVLSLVGAKLDARIELELSTVQAELQDEADRYGKASGEAPLAISKRLNAMAIALGGVASETLSLPSPTSKSSPHRPNKGDPSSNGKKRGRPRKSSPSIESEARP